ncbi:MAG: hypothetical protein GY750_01855 [Lentisphaerae bacterium]|nr:hypothetical protein [Lentisphaerota bacterium]MCP4100166.1 hypothetical protein [Lentisphaerota bacterium]
MKQSKFQILKKIITEEIRCASLTYQDLHTFSWPNSSLSELSPDGFKRTCQQAMHKSRSQSSGHEHFYISYAVHHPRHYSLLIKGTLPHASIIFSKKCWNSEHVIVDHCISFYPEESQFGDHSIFGKNSIDAFIKVHYSTIYKRVHNIKYRAMPSLHTRTYEISSKDYDYLYDSVLSSDYKRNWKKSFHQARFNCNAFVVSYLNSVGIYDSFFMHNSFKYHFPSSKANQMELSEWHYQGDALVFDKNPTIVTKYDTKYPDAYFKLCKKYIQHGYCVKAALVLLHDYANNLKLHPGRNHVETVKVFLKECKTAMPLTICELLEKLDQKINRLILPVGSLSCRYAFITEIPNIAYKAKAISKTEYEKHLRNIAGIKHYKPKVDVAEDMNYWDNLLAGYENQERSSTMSTDSGDDSSDDDDD